MTALKWLGLVLHILKTEVNWLALSLLIWEIDFWSGSLKGFQAHLQNCEKWQLALSCLPVRMEQLSSH
jgi:hypothetical protein